MQNKPNNFILILEEVRRLIQEDNYDMAEEKIRSALSSNPPSSIQLELYGLLLVTYYNQDDLKKLLIAFFEMEDHGFFTAVSDALIVKAFKKATEKLIKRRCQQLDLERLTQLTKELENFKCYNEVALINEEIAKRTSAR